MGRRFLSFVLVFTLLFANMAVPTYATSPDLATPEEFVSADEPMMLALDPVSIAISSSGLGTFLAGVGSISPIGLVALTCILGAHVLFTEVPVMISQANELISLLDEAAVAELQEIADTKDLGDSFSLSSSTAQAVNAALRSMYYTGEFNAGQLTFSSDLLIDYNFSRDYIYGEGTPSSVHQYTLIPGGSTGLGSTGLFARPIFNPFPGYDYGLRITNSTTGVSMTILSGQVADSVEELFTGACDSLKISVPFVEETYTSKVGHIYHEMGIWTLASYVDGDTTEYQANRARDYNGYTFAFENTGTAIDGVVMTGAFVTDGSSNFEVTFQGENSESYPTLALPMEYVLSYPKSVTIPADDIAAIAVNTVLTIPDEDELAHAEGLTFESVREEAAAGDNAGTADNATFWSKLWDWLQSLLDAILGLPAAIWALFVGLLESFLNVCNECLDALKKIAGAIAPDLSGIKWLVDLVASIWEAVVAVVEGVVSLFSDLPGIVVDVRDFFRELLNIYMFWEEGDAHGAVGH